MPNGGVPRHMALRPSDGSPYVCYCEEGELRVYSRADWDAARARAEPLFRLSESEGAALAWFLRHWLGEARLRPGWDRSAKVDADFDF